MWRDLIGCCGYLTGPLKFNYSYVSWVSEVPKFELNPYSWTKVASIIFLDSPVGTGFSYATTLGSYYSDDLTAARHNCEFLTKWLEDHVRFQKNPTYISGDSYSGMIVPIIIQEILNGNKIGHEPIVNLKGYILGNPATVKEDSSTSKYEFARRVSLLPDELYESTKLSCSDNYNYVAVGNLECKKNLQAISKNLDPLFGAHVLEPSCKTSSPQLPCREDNYWLFYIWANNLEVQKVLNIRQGTKYHWARCNETLAYVKNVRSSFDYHRSFTEEWMHALIYSGDQDMVVPYVGTLEWIKRLNVSISEHWRPWFVKGQVAGYSTKFSNGHYHLTFTTVKGAGHTAPEYHPEECLHMLTRWFRMEPL